ncbi:universal stress protein [Hanstruepera ponticola]|uniref:universal stress protein n=1 Tax=Hanstruepera ponticola TaxID=2042995 RepID=UPI001786C1B7|nr:universal stress protein [Hanstruepera ponticola]
MKNIIITTDFSHNATHAAEYIMNLFQYEACTFYILHVVKASSFISDDLMNMKPSSSLYSQLIESEKIKLEKEVKRLGNSFNNILHELVPIIDYDNFLEAINQCVEKNDVELIVMGTKGATNSLKKIIGSNTLHVIRNSKIPVLAIPSNYVFKPVHKILFTTTYQNEYDKSELKILIDLAEHYDFQLDILHMSENNALTDKSSKVKTHLAKAFANISHVFVEEKHADFLYTIQNYIKTHNIDMFTMINRNVDFFDRLFTSQKIEKVAYNIGVPFLALQSLD